MRNTKQRGILHFRIFKWNGEYLGICKETGFVEESESLEEVRRKLVSGTVAVLKAILKSPENLEASLNTSPPLKYAIYFRIAPLLVMIESMRDVLNKTTSETSGNYSFFTESIKTLIPQHNG